MAKTTTVLAIPTYLGRLENSEVVFSLLNATKPGSENAWRPAQSSTSANCTGFNKLYCEALDLRDKGEVTHFLMLHSDIVPEIYFIDKLHEVMERTGADVVSAVSPIKDRFGLTSTALEQKVGDRDDEWGGPRRLTMREIMRMPPTFTAPNLLINTGLMLVDLRKDWADKVFFHFDDRIGMYRGKRVPQMKPEDWNFSRDARKLGAKLFATREVKLTHRGQQDFPNSVAWGEMETDTLYHCPGVPDGVLDTMDTIPGWFHPEEGARLYLHAKEAVEVAPTFVEVGSWQGRSTFILASVCKEAWAKRQGEGVCPRVHAVDPHEGNLYANGKGVKTDPSFEAFQKNMERTEVKDYVAPLVCRSRDVAWRGDPIGLLFIDGLHDYENVKADYAQFISHVPPGGIVAFHDYGPEDPDVIRFVDELVNSKQLEHVALTGTLNVCRVPKA